MTQLVPNHWKKTDRNGSCKRIIHSPDPKLLLMLEIERESHSIYRKFFFLNNVALLCNCNAMDAIPYVSYAKHE